MKPFSKYLGIIVGSLLIVEFAVAQSPGDDLGLASRFAPVFHLSAPNSEGNPVDLQSGNYLYSDFHPMRVDNLLSPPPATTIDLRLASPVTIGQNTYAPADYSLNVQGYINLLGTPGIRSASNSLLLNPLWTPFQIDEQIAFKERAGDPTVYFRVFRSADSKNPKPIAVQYWFFYFYNDWVLTHPGDWESVTVFLNANAEPKEIVYSTHHEANRYSWTNEIFEDSRSGDHIPVFVSNGGHGSYAFAGETDYSGIPDLHWGDGGTFDFQNGDYALIDLSELEKNQNSWIWFEGRWGNDGIDIGEDEDPAPMGPMFRKDAQTGGEWFRSNNRPYDPFNNCLKRDYGANIYDPWYWASGYGLDTPWSSSADCQSTTINLPAPENLNTQALGNQLFIGWDPVANASGYKVLIGTSSGRYDFEFEIIGSTFFNTSLGDGTYYVRVVAFNQFGESELSQEAVVVVGPGSEPPSPPANIEVLIENTTVTISWDTVLGASGYIAQYGLAPGQYIESVDLGTATEVSAVVSYGSYYLKLAAYYGNQVPGDYSDEIEIVVVEPVPIDPPTLVSPGTTAPPVPTISGLSATLKWNPVPDAISYNLNLRDLTTNNQVLDLDGVGTTSFVVTSLQPGRLYRWNVQACNSTTCSDFSERLYFETN